jgi:hypothetical protein
MLTLCIDIIDCTKSILPINLQRIISISSIPPQDNDVQRICNVNVCKLEVVSAALYTSIYNLNVGVWCGILIDRLSDQLIGDISLCHTLDLVACI